MATQARKLLLRGYAVKALVRSKDEEVKASLPRAVQVVYGDVGEPADCKEALKVHTRRRFSSTPRHECQGKHTACVACVSSPFFVRRTPSRCRKAEGIYTVDS